MPENKSTLPIQKGAKRIKTCRSNIHGTGVFAQVDLAEGERIIEYKGEQISQEEADRRRENSTKDDDHTFFFSLENGNILDGDAGGNSARFINHSCEPNCYADEQKGKIVIYALKNIASGEELFFDYNLVVGARHTQKMKAQYQCRCGAKQCRGTMLMVRSKPRAPTQP